MKILLLNGLLLMISRLSLIISSIIIHSVRISLKFFEKFNSRENSCLHFETDKVFDESRSTSELFEEVANPIVENALKGYNGTIFAYGQTSSGKVCYAKKVSC